MTPVEFRRSVEAYGRRTQRDMERTIIGAWLTARLTNSKSIPLDALLKMTGSKQKVDLNERAIQHEALMAKLKDRGLIG